MISLIGCPTFFVRPLGRTGRFQNIADANIMDIAVYSSINLYAQLALLAKLRAKDCRPSFSAGAVLHLLILRGAPKTVSFFDGCSDFFMDRNQVQKSTVQE